MLKMVNAVKTINKNDKNVSAMTPEVVLHRLSYVRKTYRNVTSLKRMN